MWAPAGGHEGRPCRWNMLAQIGRRLLMLFRRRRFHADLDEEMPRHRELRERDEIERGLSPKEAHQRKTRGRVDTRFS